MKRLFILMLALLLLLSGCSKGAGKAGETVLGDFTAYDLNGDKQTEAIFTGKKLTMINVWATYCGPCIREMPALAAISKKYKDSDFQIIGIVSDVSFTAEAGQQTARELLKEAGAEYINLLPDASYAGFLRTIMYVPTTVFVDENGCQVGEPIVSAKSQDEWENIIREKLEEVQ